MEGCSEVTTGDLLPLIQKCTKLKYLDINRCIKVSLNSILDYYNMMLHYLNYLISSILLFSNHNYFLPCRVYFISVTELYFLSRRNGRFLMYLFPVETQNSCLYEASSVKETPSSKFTCNVQVSFHHVLMAQCLARRAEDLRVPGSRSQRFAWYQII